MGRRTTRGAALAAAGLPGAASARAHTTASRAARARRPMNPSLRSLLTEPHPYPGRLITVEGIDGSGKSTQLLLLERWLVTRGYRVHFTEWNSSPLVRRSMKRGKKKDLLTPTTFSLLHAVDFADRLTYQILPPLKAGMIVLADRYVYTALGRDVARGVPTWRSTSASRSRCRSSGCSPGGRSSSTTRRGWTWDSRPIRSRASGSFRAACSRFTTSSRPSSGCP